MALIIEDGTAKTDSETYASEAELAAYAAARGITITGTDTQLLITAMDYIEQQPFKGSKGSDAQALQWPRWGVIVDSYAVATDAIPDLLKEAQMEVALGVDAGNNPMASTERQTKREKVGEIEVEYMDGAYDAVYLKAAEMKLRKLLKSGGGINAMVYRG